MIDLDDVFRLWNLKVEPMLDELKDLELDDSPITSSTDKASQRTMKAEVSRQLLEASDTLDLMSQMVRQEYWTMKGSGVFVEIGEINAI